MLFNIGVTLPKLSYYQGMNYIAIFIYLTFEKDVIRSYRMLYYISKTYLMNTFNNNFDGLVETMYVCDKFLQFE